jgi:hypothetical protein
MMRTGTTRISFGVLAAIVMRIFAAAWMAGCGVKSAPVPPEQARPERILDLHAVPAIGGIQLTWGRPTHYAGGHSMRDLSGFVVMRAEGDGPFQPLLEIPVTDQERFQIEHQFAYLDGETTMGTRYRYTVVSETSDGYRSDASNEVEVTRIRPAPSPSPENFKLPTPAPLPTS